MEEAYEDGKELSNSAHGNGMNELINDRQNSKLDLCEKKWRPNSLIWLLDSDLKYLAPI
jgi:hypothetical protein